MLRVLLETGFLLALNPRDRHHRWALNILEDAKERRIKIYLSPIAPLELSLVLRSRDRSEKDIYQSLEALNTLIHRYTRIAYPLFGINHVIYASMLRTKHPMLTFFDSLHASIALLNNLTYQDLDVVIKKVIESERRSEDALKLMR